MNLITDNVAGSKNSILDIIMMMFYSILLHQNQGQEFTEIYSFCRNNEVPRGCWDFCRGRTPSVEVAAATGLVNGAIDDCMPHMKTIGKCFQEGQYTLPGPPRNLKVWKTFSKILDYWNDQNSSNLTKNKCFIHFSRYARSMQTQQLHHGIHLPKIQRLRRSTE